MKNAMDIYGVCFLHAGIAIFNCILGAFTIPDNRGKSLVKVEENYKKKRGYDNSIDLTDLWYSKIKQDSRDLNPRLLKYAPKNILVYN